jgi:hypothetical protein
VFHGIVTKIGKSDPHRWLSPGSGEVLGTNGEKSERERSERGPMCAALLHCSDVFSAALAPSIDAFTPALRDPGGKTECQR